MIINLIERYLTYLKNETTKSKLTVEQYGNDLYKFCEYMNFSCNDDLINITKEQTQAYSAYLHTGCHNYAGNSINKKLATLKAFYWYLEKEEIIDKNWFRFIKLDKVKQKPIKILKTFEIKDFMGGCKNIRDRAIMNLYLSTGIRFGELVNISIKDIKYQSNKIIVTRKGGNKQAIPIPQDTMDTISTYIVDFRIPKMKQLNITDAMFPYLFISNTGKQMVNRALNKTIKDIGKRAGIEDWDKLTNHKLRHSIATKLFKEKTDPKIVQVLLGHSSITTTLSRYDHPDEETVSEVVQENGFNIKEK